MEPALALVAEEFGVTPEELVAPGKMRRVSLPRQIVIHLASRRLGMRLATIGRALQRHHTSVHFGLRTIARRLEEDAALRYTVNRLEQRLAEVVR